MIDYNAYLKLFADGITWGLGLGLVAWLFGYGIAIIFKFFKKIF